MPRVRDMQGIPAHITVLKQMTENVGIPHTVFSQKGKERIAYVLAHKVQIITNIVTVHRNAIIMKKNNT